MSEGQSQSLRSMPDEPRLPEREELIELRRVYVGKIGVIDCILDSKSPWQNLGEMQRFMAGLALARLPEEDR